VTSPKRILVAEDNKFLRKACETTLLHLGFVVDVAEDGEKALSSIASARPDLLVLDVLMPKIGGLEVLRRVRSDKATQSLPVLVLTNSSREDDISEMRQLGVQGYEVKANLSLAELGLRVKSLLRE
jgi:DNA-binding response OmpR family regulator